VTGGKESVSVQYLAVGGLLYFTDDNFKW